MRKVILMLMLVLTGVSMGCGKKNQRAPVSNADGRGGRAGDSGVSATADFSVNGGMYRTDDFSDSDWQYNIKGFVAAVIPEDYLGHVNGDWNNTGDKTGVVFGGRVKASSGSITAAGSNGRVSITSDSRILVLVYDEYVGQKDADGKQIPAIPTYLTNASGYVEGNTAVITFSDSRGSVTIRGTFGSDGTFQGPAAYVNKVDHAGQSISEEQGRGSLGWAIVRSCAFFVCN